MRSSAVVALALLASAGPTISAPVSSYSSYARRAATSTPIASSSTDVSGAFSLEDAKNVASIGSSIVSAFHNIFGRDEFEQLLARAAVDESGAFSLEDAKNIASIGSSIVSAFHNIFGG